MSHRVQRKTNMVCIFSKRDSNTDIFLWNLLNIQDQWWLLLKTRNIKLAIFNAIYCITFIVNLMMRHGTLAWCGVTLKGTSRQQKRAPKTFSCCIIYACVYHFTFYQRKSRIIFKFCFSKSCSLNRVTKTTYFGNFTRLQTKLSKPKPPGEC